MQKKEKLKRRYRMAHNKETLRTAVGIPRKTRDKHDVDAKEEKAYSEYLVRTALTNHRNACVTSLHSFRFAQGHVDREREEARLRHILEHRPTGPQPTPPMAGDDAARREARSMEANEQLRRAYMDQIVRAVL